MKTAAYFAATLVVALGAWSLYAMSNGGLPVELAEVRRGPIREFVDEQGKTRLPKTHVVTMPYNGRVESIELTEGTPVKAGQVVACVVPVDLELETRQAEAAVERLEASIAENRDVSVEETGLKQALNYVTSMDLTVQASNKRQEAGKARYDFAKKSYDRVRPLAKSKDKTEEELNRAELAVVEGDVEYQQDVLVFRALQALQAATALLPTAIRQYMGRKNLSAAVLEKERQQAVAHLEQVKTNRQRGTMTSHVDGVVLSRPITNERHQAAGTVLLEIGRLDDLEVEAEVLSQEVVKVQPGDEVEIHGPAIGAPAARGKVSRIYPAGFTKISSLGVEQQRVMVIVQFEPDEVSRLRIERDLGVGYRVNVKIFTASNDQALLIPRSALFRGAAGDWQVFVLREGKARLTSIEAGLMNDELVEVVKGLGEGDRVILAPESSLADGARVKDRTK